MKKPGNSISQGWLLIILIFLSILTIPPTQLLASDYIYVVNLYHGNRFTVHLSDVDTMLREGRLFSVKISGGRLSEIIIATKNSISKIVIGESIIPNKSTNRIFYEFSGYSLRASIDSASYLSTTALQGHKVFLHTVCLDSNFTLMFTFFNESTIYSKSTTYSQLKAVVISFQGLFLAIALHDSLGHITVNNNSSVVIKSYYSCLTLIWIGANNLSELLETLNMVSLEACYKQIEHSKSTYAIYVSQFPFAESSIKQLNDLYFIALYSRLNTLLYPEIYGLPIFEKLVAYYISSEILLPLNSTMANTLALGALNDIKPMNPRETLMYIKLAELIGDLDRIRKVCNTILQTTQNSNISETLDRIIIDKIEQICKGDPNSQEIISDIANLSIVDVLALTRMKLAKVSIPITFRGIVPNNPWTCLAFTEMLQKDIPYVHEVLSLPLLDNLFYACLDYAVLKGIAGIEIVGNEIKLQPSIPKMLDELTIGMSIGSRELKLNYRGWGDKIKYVKLNSIRIDINSIPLNTLLEGVNTIDIEMDTSPPVMLQVIVLYNGIALNKIPVYAEVIGPGTKYSAISITDISGKAVFTVLPNSLVTIIVNSTKIGLVNLRTKVGENDMEIIVDVGRDFTEPREIVGKLSSIEMRLQELENEVKSRTFPQQSYVDRAKTDIIFSSLALLASIVALALALAEIRR